MIPDTVSFGQTTGISSLAGVGGGGAIFWGRGGGSAIDKGEAGMTGAATGGGLGCDVCGGVKAVCVGCGVKSWATVVVLDTGGGTANNVVLFVAPTDRLETIDIGVFVGPTDFTINVPGLLCQSPSP